MSVREAQLKISSAEFTEWMAYYQLEPFGDLIADQRHGTATALLANVNRNAETRPEPYRASDFIPWRAEESTPEDLEPAPIDDPVAHSDLIRAAIFGIAPKQK